ncbi:MAG: hypothetical protein AVDCRST_MAG05-4694, partial [uncultured Rubrobacteraceae bacterium]
GEEGGQAGGVLGVRDALRGREPAARGLDVQDERRRQDHEPRGAFRPVDGGLYAWLLAAPLHLDPLRPGLSAAPGQRGNSRGHDGRRVLPDRVHGRLRHRPPRLPPRQHLPDAGAGDGPPAAARRRGPAARPLRGTRALRQPPGDAGPRPPLRATALYLVSRGVLQGAAGRARGGHQGRRHRDVLARNAACRHPGGAHDRRPDVRLRLEPVPVRQEPGLRGEAAALRGRAARAPERPPARHLGPGDPTPRRAGPRLRAPGRGRGPGRLGQNGHPGGQGAVGGADPAGGPRRGDGRAAPGAELGSHALCAPRVGGTRLPLPAQLRGRPAARPGGEARELREHLLLGPHERAVHHLQLPAVLPARPGALRVALRAGVVVRAPDLARKRRCDGPLRLPHPLHAYPRPDRRDGRGPHLPCHPLRPALVLPGPGGPPRPRPLVGGPLRRRPLARQAQGRSGRSTPVRRRRPHAPDVRARSTPDGVRVAHSPGPSPPGAGARGPLLRARARRVRGAERLDRRRLLPAHRYGQHKRVQVGAGKLQRARGGAGLPAAPARRSRVRVAGPAGPGVVARGALPGAQRPLGPPRRQGRLGRQLPARALRRALPGDRGPPRLAARAPAAEGAPDLASGPPGARARPVLPRPLGPAELRGRPGEGGAPALPHRRRGRRPGPDGRAHGPPAAERQAHQAPALRDDPTLPRRVLEPGAGRGNDPGRRVRRRHDVGAPLRQGHKEGPLDRGDAGGGRGPLRAEGEARGHGGLQARM